VASAWFNFGGAGAAQSLAAIRVATTTKAGQVLRTWLDERPRSGIAATFVESEWKSLHKEKARLGRSDHTRTAGSYKALLAGCLALRVDHPRGDQALRLDRSSDLNELERLSRRVLDSSQRSARTPSLLATTATAMAAPPASFLYWCELLQTLSPWLGDWESLTGSIAAVANGIAILYNDGRPPDWSAADRLIRDGIGWLTWWIMTQAAVDRGPGRTAWKMFEASGRTIEKPVIAEVRRLHREGVLLARRNYSLKGLGVGQRFHPWRYRLGARDWHELIDRSKPILI
jgi:hypothetical protein